MTKDERERMDRFEGKIDQILEKVHALNGDVQANTRFRRTLRSLVIALSPVILLSLISLVAWAVVLVGK